MTMFQLKMMLLLIKEDAALLVLFSFKILGAAALEGHSLEELTALGRSITENLHTLESLFHLPTIQ